MEPIPAETPLDALTHVAEIVRAGVEYHETLRQLLARFGQARRGAVVNQRIANTLASAGLRTEPDFREAGIDDQLAFALADAPPIVPPAPPEIDDAPEAENAPTQPLRDTTLFRVVRFVTDDKRAAKLVAVAPETSVVQATTQMLAYDYSQLPVLSNPGRALGFFSWRSYGQALSLGRMPTTVRDCLDDAHEVAEQDPVGHLIDLVQRHDAVLVRGADRTFATLFTAADLADFYRDLSEDFVLLGQIETDLRALIDRARFTVEELQAARPPGDTSAVTRVDDLSFGSYLALIGQPVNWTRLALPIDRGTFVAELETVRELRNAVMHFDPDGLSAADKACLARVARFLGVLRTTAPPVP